MDDDIELRYYEIQEWRKSVPVEVNHQGKVTRRGNGRVLGKPLTVEGKVEGVKKIFTGLSQRSSS